MKKGIQALIVSTVLAFASDQALALTLEELRHDPNLTPERMLSLFADFRFELREEVQAPERFLAAGAGDCDDFATLAADILRAKGYTPRLVVVFMPRDIHVVCFVAEVRGYLDFNNRSKLAPLVRSNGTLSDIAAKVADSFGTTWHCASGFTFRKGVRHFVYTDFRQATPPPPTATGKLLVVERE